MSEKQIDDDVDLDAASTLTFRVEPEQAGERLDRFLATCCQVVEMVPGEVPLSRARLQALIKAGDVVRVGGAGIDNANTKVKAGETYQIQLPPPVDAEPLGEAIPLDIVYEDRDLIVIDKPAGLVVHPAAGHAGGTLVNALIGHCGDTLSGIGGVRRPGIVHRLDKDTSGLLVVAKTDAAHQGLSAQFQSHGLDGKLVRRYLALVWGAPERPKGKIETSLGRSGSNRTKIAVVAADAGRHAVTHYDRAAVYGDPPQASLMSLVLETGRTHQIRVHLAHIGHPVMGDPVYALSHLSSARKLTEGARDALTALGRQALHATELGFEHPRTGKAMHFERPPPADMLNLMKHLRALSAGKRQAHALTGRK